MVSSLGRVKSLPRIDKRANGTQKWNAGRLLKHTLNRGYPMASLALHGNASRKYRIHILVAAAFIGPRPPGHDINHKNGDKTDNQPTNLEYVTRSENNKHAYAAGLKPLPRGEQGGRSVLTEEQALYAWRMKGIKFQREIAEELGCSKAAIANIHAGRAWQHVSEASSDS